MHRLPVGQNPGQMPGDGWAGATRVQQTWRYRVRLASERFSVLLFLVTAAAVVSCGPGPGLPDNAVLQVEGDTIHIDELGPRLADAKGDTAMAMRIGNAVLNRMLILHDASARGLDTLYETRRYNYEKMRESLQQRFLQHLLERVEVSSDSVRQFYGGLGTMVEYLVVSARDSSVARQWETRLRAGHEPSVHLGNDLRIETMGPVDLMRLPNETAGVLEDLQQGAITSPRLIGEYWKVYRLDSLWESDPGTFEENRDWIEGMLLAGKRELVKQALEDSLRAEYDLSTDTTVVEMIAEKATGRRGDHLPYSREEARMPAYTWRGGSRPALWLANNIRSLPEPMPRRADDPEWIAGYCRILGLYDIMATAAAEMGLDTLPRVRDRVRVAREQYLLDVYHDSVIVSRIAVEEEELIRAYENQEEPITVPRKRVFELLMAEGGHLVEALDSVLAAGSDPFETSGLFDPHPNYAESESTFVTRPMRAGELPSPLADSLLAVPEGSVIRFDMGDEAAALFRAGAVHPAREATFEEVRETLRQRLRSAREEEAVNALVDSLRQVYDYRINRSLILNNCGFDSTAADSVGGGE